MQKMDSISYVYISWIMQGMWMIWPPLWSSGQSFWLQIQRSRVRSPALPDFLGSSRSGTGSTQPREPREVNWGANWIKKKSSGSRSRKQRLTAVGTRCADHVTRTSPTGGGRSVGKVRVRTKAAEFSYVNDLHNIWRTMSYVFKYHR